jgi:integrase/recombinase XerD
MTAQNNSLGLGLKSEHLLIEGFLRDCELRRLSTESIKGYKSILQIVSNVLRKKGLCISKLDNQSLKEVLQFLARRKFAYKTLVWYFTALSGFCDYLIWEGMAQANPVPPFRKRYIRQYKSQYDPERKLISVEEMAMLINSVLDPRDKAILALLAKTGVRRAELIRIDLDDIDWLNQSIQLKPHPKRSNCTVFFDDETSRVLRRWVQVRQNHHIEPRCKALFINAQGGRLKRNGVYNMATKYAASVGLHNPKSNRMEDRLTPHCFRHWFTTNLRRNGMRREMIQELRGDARNEAVDIYDHIDKKELKRAYIAAVPILGIE